MKGILIYYVFVIPIAVIASQHVTPAAGDTVFSVAFGLFFRVVGGLARNCVGSTAFLTLAGEMLRRHHLKAT